MKFSENIRLHYIALFALAILLYANTLQHGFVLDDEVVITQNTYVKQGLKGIPAIFAHDSFAGFERVGEGKNLLAGGRYRPLSIALFAIVYSIFGASTIAFHGLSILLFACCSLMLYKLLMFKLKDTSSTPKSPMLRRPSATLFSAQQPGDLLAFLTSVLFIIHPIHTEVVANVKSCDEQLALLLGLASLYGLFRWWDTKNWKWAILTGLLFFGACLAKENAITLVVVGPLALWFFRKTKLSDVLLSSIPLIIASVLLLILRGSISGMETPGQVMHDPLNNPFLQWTGQEWVDSSMAVKAATIIYTFGHYVRLMVFPFPLIHGYYPFHFELPQLSNSIVLISVLIFLVMTVYGIISLRKRDIAGFGILFFLVTLSITANVIVNIGAFMAERFLYLPSVGFCLAATVWIVRLFGKKNSPLVMAFFYGVLIVVFGFLTIKRNQAWKDNETLVRTDIVHSPKSVKFQNEMGVHLLTKALAEIDSQKRITLLEEATTHLKTAIDLHPTNYDAYLAYGAATYYLGQYMESVVAYRTSYQIYPDDAKSKTGLVFALQAYGNDLGTKKEFEAAISALLEAWQLQPDVTTASNLANYYRALGQSKKVVEWYEKAVALSPNDAELKNKLEQARVKIED